MKLGEAIIQLLRDKGPLTEDQIAAEMVAKCDVAPVITGTTLVGMEYRKAVVLTDGRYSLPEAEKH